MACSQRIDSIVKFAGSWAFIFSFTGVLILWMVVNTVLAAKAFDPYPFILLNLVLSCVAAIQAPLIMMSQNQEIVAEVLFFCEYWHSSIDTANAWCYNSGVLRRKGKRRAARLPGKPFAGSFKM